MDMLQEMMVVRWKGEKKKKREQEVTAGVIPISTCQCRWVRLLFTFRTGAVLQAAEWNPCWIACISLEKGG